MPNNCDHCGKPLPEIEASVCDLCGALVCEWCGAWVDDHRVGHDSDPMCFVCLTCRPDLKEATDE